MSSSAYQRAVSDMKQAGLNPMLAYQQGGASSPQGASAVFNSEAGAGVNAALQANMNSAQVANLEAQTAKTEAETKNISASFETVLAQLDVTKWTARHLQEMTDKVNEETVTVVRARELLKEQIGIAQWERVRKEFEAKLAKFDLEAIAPAERDKIAATAHLLELSMPEAYAEAAMHSSAYGAKRPYLRDIGAGISGAGRAVRDAAIARGNRS